MKFAFVCLLIGLSWAQTHGADVGAVDRCDANTLGDARITTLCDDMPLMSALNDVLRAYKLHAVVVFRPEDSDLSLARTRDVLLKDYSPQQYFEKVTQLFSGYTYEYDSETRCWFIAPNDDSAAVFRQEVQCRFPKDVTIMNGISVLMGGVSNACRLPPAGESLNELDRSYSRNRMRSWQQQPFFVGSNSTFEITDERCVRWKGIGHVLKNVPHSYLYVYKVSITNSLDEEQQIARYAEDESEVPKRVESVTGTPMIIKDRKSGEQRHCETNYFWSICKTMDCSTMTDREIVDAYAKDFNIHLQMAPQLLRMSEKRIMDLYKMTDPSRRRAVFGMVVCHPQLRYTDAAIRINIDLVRSSDFGTPPIAGLLYNYYSPEIQLLTSALITEGSVYWKGLAYEMVLYAPTFIPLDVRTAWRSEMELGRQDRNNRHIAQSFRTLSERLGAGVNSNVLALLKSRDVVVSEETKAKMRANIEAYETSPETLRNIQIASQNLACKIQTHLRVLGVNTNRSFAWVWEAAGLAAPTNRVPQSDFL